MSSARLVSSVVGAAVALGIIGDFLLRAPEPGLNVALCVWGLAAYGLVLEWKDRSRWPWVAALFFAAMWAIRDAELLMLADLLAAGSLLALALLQSRSVALRVAGAVDVLTAPLRAARDTAIHALELAGVLKSRAPSRMSVVGALLAVPVVFVFGGLFVAADPVLDAAVSPLLDGDLGRFVSHVALAGFLAAMSGGFWWAIVNAKPAPSVRLGGDGTPWPVLAPVGAAVVVFTAFIAVQARSLFGGEAFVLAQTGLTYAEYARGGFFQILFASVLSLPLVYVAWFAAGVSSEKDTTSLRYLLAVQVSLTGLVLLSALWRMGLYIGAYGLTEDRLYGMAVMLWIGGTLAVFAATVVRGRPTGAPFGSIVAAVIALAALNVANPKAIIAGYNLANHDRRTPDFAHLAGLGGDAVPALVQRFDLVGEDKRCVLAGDLRARYGGHRFDWRGWNLARERARKSVATLDDLLADCETLPGP